MPYAPLTFVDDPDLRAWRWEQWSDQPGDPLRTDRLIATILSYQMGQRDPTAAVDPDDDAIALGQIHEVLTVHWRNQEGGYDDPYERIVITFNDSVRHVSTERLILPEQLSTLYFPARVIIPWKSGGPVYGTETSLTLRRRSSPGPGMPDEMFYPDISIRRRTKDRSLLTVAAIVVREALPF